VLAVGWDDVGTFLGSFFLQDGINISVPFCIWLDKKEAVSNRPVY
jgi:hypothetical protein